MAASEPLRRKYIFKVTPEPGNPAPLNAMILDFTLQSVDVFFCDKISGEGEITLLRPCQDSPKLSGRLTLMLSDKSVVAYAAVANLLREWDISFDYIELIFLRICKRYIADHVNNRSFSIDIQRRVNGAIFSTGSEELISKSEFATFIDKLQDDCAICMESLLGNKGDGAWLPCLHLFHESCISEWLSRTLTCPLCRCNFYEVSSNETGLDEATFGEDGFNEASSRESTYFDGVSFVEDGFNEASLDESIFDEVSSEVSSFAIVDESGFDEGIFDEISSHEGNFIEADHVDEASSDEDSSFAIYDESGFDECIFDEDLGNGEV